MAEVFGIVAGAVTLVEVAARIGSRSLRVKQMWEETKNVPTTAYCFLDEIELFKDLIYEIEDDFHSSPQECSVWTGRVSRRMLSYCSAALNELETLVEELSKELSHQKRFNRGLAKIKFSLKKDFWAQHESRLAKVVQMFGVAQQAYTMAMMKQQPDIIVTRLQAAGMLSETVHELAPVTWSGEKGQKMDNKVPLQVQALPTKCRKKQSQSTNHGSISSWIPPTWYGNFALRSTTKPSSTEGYGYADDNGRSRHHHLQLRMPSWLSHRAWDVLAANSLSGYTFQFRMYSIVPNDAAVFQCAKRGDIDGMQALFDKGLASPSDKNEDGKTLLQCIPVNAVGSIKRILSWGCDLSEIFDIGVRRDRKGSNRLYASRVLKAPDVSMPNDVLISHLQVLNEIAVSAGTYDQLDDTCLGESVEDVVMLSGRSRWGMIFMINPCFMPLLLPILKPEYYQLPARERLSALEGIPAFRKIEKLRYSLWQDGVVRKADIQELEEDGVHMIKHLAELYWDRVVRGVETVYPVSPPQDLREITRLVLETTAALHHRQNSVPRSYSPVFLAELTPLTTIIARRYYWKGLCLSKWRRACAKVVRYWLEDLVQSGRDLYEYGKEERRIYKEQCETFYAFSDLWFPFPRPWALEDFTYGPEPKDWRFLWDLRAEDNAREFWELIDNPPLHIPGDWVDDGYDSDYDSA